MSRVSCFFDSGCSRVKLTVVECRDDTCVPDMTDINQSINQYIYNAPWYRGACYSADYAEAKRNVLSRVLNVSTDGAVRQFRGSEFQSLGAASSGTLSLTQSINHARSTRCVCCVYVRYHKHCWSYPGWVPGRPQVCQWLAATRHVPRLCRSAVLCRRVLS